MYCPDFPGGCRLQIPLMQWYTSTILLDITFKKTVVSLFIAMGTETSFFALVIDRSNGQLYVFDYLHLANKTG